MEARIYLIKMALQPPYRGLGSLGAATAVGAVTLPVSIIAGLMYAASRKKQNFTGEPLSLHEEAWSRSPLANQVVNPGMEALKPG